MNEVCPPRGPKRKKKKNPGGSYLQDAILKPPWGLAKRVSPHFARKRGAMVTPRTLSFKSLPPSHLLSWTLRSQVCALSFIVTTAPGNWRLQSWASRASLCRKVLCRARWNSGIQLARGRLVRVQGVLAPGQAELGAHPRGHNMGCGSSKPSENHRPVSAPKKVWEEGVKVKQIKTQGFAPFSHSWGDP